MYKISIGSIVVFFFLNIFEMKITYNKIIDMV